MFKKILVPTDGSELSAKAIAGAIEMAAKIGAKLVGITVVEPYAYGALAEYRPESPDEYEKRAEAVAGDRLARLQRDANEAKVEVETVVAKNFSPYVGIIEAVKERGCDAIFMASHGRRGLSGMLLGSETQKVLTHASVPVMVYR